MLSALALLYAVIILLLVTCSLSYAILASYAVLRPPRAIATPEYEASKLPLVTVQLPIYNEGQIVERLIDRAVALDYPAGRLEIQVLDDSTDETSRVVDERVALHRAQGIDISVLRRTHREGFKAGALREGLQVARGEFIAIFDADFCPSPDFLLRTVPHFFGDPRLGVVQGRWAHLNADHRLLTRVQAMILDGHFMIEQWVRCSSGLLMTFNGTAGVWRRSCIEDSGGWQSHSLAEDLDLSFRAHLAGWRFQYLPDVAVDAELPVQLGAFKRQQARWAQGAIQALRKLFWKILLSPRLRWHQKTMAFAHLSAYFTHPLMILLLMGAPAFAQLPSSMRLDIGLANLVFLAPPAFYVVAQRLLFRGWGRSRFLPAVTLVGIGIAWSNTLAVWRGLTRYGGHWHRTPKSTRKGSESAVGSVCVRIAPTAWGDLLLALYAVAVLGVAVATPGQFWMAPYLILCVLALGSVAVIGFTEGLSVRPPAPARAASTEESPAPSF